METKFKNLTDLHKNLGTEEQCREHLEQLRWNGTPTCPYCSCQKVYRFKDKRNFKCAECRKRFSVTVGTIFENTKLPLTKWFLAMYLCVSHKKGISSLQLSRDLGIGQKAAWFVLHRIREMLREKAPYKIENIAEIDETFVGGKNKNRHKDKRKAYSQGGGQKAIMFGILERKGKVYAQLVPNREKSTLLPIINEKIKPGTTIVTDELVSYKTLKKDYDHLKVRHRKKEYVRGIAHTNGIENFWSLFKRGINGIYHAVSVKHIDAYVNEYTARFNTRHESEEGRFNGFVSQCNGRLKYKDLINNNENNK